MRYSTKETQQQKTRILNAIPKIKHPITAKKLVDKTKLSYHRTLHLIDILEAEGKLKVNLVGGMKFIENVKRRRNR